MKRLVLWGGRQGLDSFRHIHRHYHETARKIGIESYWVEDDPKNLSYLTPGTVVFTVDVWSKHIAARPDVDYVIHNYDASHPLMSDVDDNRLLRLQVWTNDSFGEEWDKCRQFDKAGKVLFQPWGTDLLAEEFLDPIFNQPSREAVFVGAIWSDFYEGEDLGNSAAIEELKAVCTSHGLFFKHMTHISDQDNIAAVRSARLAPAFAGGWQTRKNYLPCRVFKNASYGVLAMTNVPKARELLGGAGLEGDTVSEIVDGVLKLRHHHYLALVREQQRRVARYTYRESIAAISRALAEIK